MNTYRVNAASTIAIDRDPVGLLILSIGDAELIVSEDDAPAMLDRLESAGIDAATHDRETLVFVWGDDIIDMCPMAAQMVADEISDALNTLEDEREEQRLAEYRDMRRDYYGGAR